MSETLHRFSFIRLGRVVSSLRRRAMRRSSQHFWVRAGLALVLHTQQYLHRESSRTMIRKPRSTGCDLTSLRQQCYASFLQLRASILQSRCRLPASPFKVPGTGWAPQGRVGVSPETPGAGREKSLLSLRLQTTGAQVQAHLGQGRMHSKYY
ncbi:hypothetical protein NDU88_007283 [Pleurodeles waltl]|uniref:Uncharacterized protein n=1 Tax=Pleurodeles waltl TaxID=8319 RepID=A0AAV7UQL1_PLEWA|nr:hypothetical protein NDU88_007283 [Pleurodeles waltl]